MCITITYMDMCLSHDTEANRRGVLYQPTTENRETPWRERNNRWTSRVPMLATSQEKPAKFRWMERPPTSGPTSLLLVPGVEFFPIQLLAFRGYTQVTMLYCAYNY